MWNPEALTRDTMSLCRHRVAPSLQTVEQVSEGRLGCKTETGQVGVAMGDEILSELPTKDNHLMTKRWDECVAFSPELLRESDEF